ncbi:uncharacterized protein V1513DRAFT_451661 [Lipomyces chichibuensis]|uniref:uncharacterized protein n=1 Tax=Lipomyces chichibuensis TaxID=1546026 RepID=UPI0033437C18
MPLPADDNRYRRVIIETCCRIHQLRICFKFEPIWKDFGNMLFTDIVRNDRIGQFYHSL